MDYELFLEMTHKSAVELLEDIYHCSYTPVETDARTDWRALRDLCATTAT